MPCPRGYQSSSLSDPFPTARVNSVREIKPRVLESCAKPHFYTKSYH